MSARWVLPTAAKLAAIAWLASALAFTDASAEDAGWVVTELSGSATVESADGATVMAAPDLQVPEGARVVTGESGRVTLARGDTDMTLSPGTEIQIRAAATDDTTSIFQRVGMLLLKVERRTNRHFEVETPYLAAVVKGTRFTVSVAERGAAVHVTEGAVEVSTPQAAAPLLVHPGQTATVDAGALDQLRLDGPQSRSPGAERTTAAAQPRQAGDGDAKQAIRRPIGDTEIDVRAATGGLVGMRDSTRAIAALTDGDQEAAAGTDGLAASLPDGSVTQTGGGLVANVGTSVGGATESLGGVTGGLGEVTSGVTGGLGEVTGGVTGGLGAVTGGVTGTLGSTVQETAETTGNVVNTVGNLVGGLLGLGQP